MRPEHVGPLVAALGDAYYASEAAIREAVLRRSSFNLIHLDTMLKIDVFVSRGRPYDAVALSRRLHQRADAAEAAPALYIATAEDIVLAKLQWFRAGDEASEQQWRDILGVLRVQGESIDAEYLREWAGRLSVLDLVERALRERDAE